MHADEIDQAIRAGLQAELNSREPATWESPEAVDRLLERVMSGAPVVAHRRGRTAWQWVAAAALLVGVGGAFWAQHGRGLPGNHPPTVEADQSAVVQAYNWLLQHGTGKNLGGPLWQPDFSPSLSSVVQLEAPINTWQVNLWATPKRYPVNSPTVMHGHSGAQPIISWSVTSESDTARTLLKALASYGHPEGPPKTIALGSGIAGAMYREAWFSQVTGRGDILVWRQGTWSLEVVGSSSAAVIEEARTLAAYCAMHPLPATRGVMATMVLKASPSTAAPHNTTVAVWVARGLTIRLTNMMPGLSNGVSTAHMVMSWQWLNP